MSSGASTPPEVPEPSDDGPDDGFDEEDPEHESARHVALQQGADGVVADPEGLRKEQAAEADDEPADRRPPHPVNRETREDVLRGVDGAGEQRPRARRRAARRRRNRRARRPDEGGMGRHGEEGAEPDDVAARGAGRGAGERDGDQAAGLPLEQEQLDGQQDGRERRGEGRGHPGCGARDQQRLALGTGKMKELRDQRAEGAAGHDDRTLRAEGAAGSDRDGRRQRLEDGDFWLDPAAVESGSPRWPRGCRGRGSAPTRSAPSGR